MSRHTLLSVIGFLVLSISILGGYLYKYANTNLEEIPKDIKSDNALGLTQDSSEKIGWLDKLANADKKEYALPVNEIYIEYARPLKLNIKTAYQLLVDKNDGYSMFCIMQTLKNTNVDFTIVKDSVKSQIFLNTNDSELLQSVITQLKAYDIQTSVVEVKI